MHLGKILEKISLVFLGIFLAIIILEGTLRLGGFIYITAQNSKISTNNYGEKIDILVLGESTSAGFNHAWPSLLEDLLNKDYEIKKYFVHNEARPGTNTAFLLSRIESYLELYKPDIVISMMGINDPEHLLSDNHNNNGINFFDDLRTYKLFNIIYESWKERNRKEKLQNPLYFDEAIILANEAFVNSEFDTAILLYEDYINKHGSNFLVEANLGDSYLNIGDEKNALIHLKTSLDYPSSDFGDYDSVIPSVVLLLNNEGYSMEMIYEYLENHSIENIKISLNLPPGYATRMHYNMLSKILKENNITYISMQYPNVDINVIKEILFYDSSIIYISNEENFKESRYNFNKYFTDDFGRHGSLLFKGNFGHTTELGSKLIAENVAEAIINITT